MACGKPRCTNVIDFPTDISDGKSRATRDDVLGADGVAVSAIDGMVQAAVDANTTCAVCRGLGQPRDGRVCPLGLLGDSLVMADNAATVAVAAIDRVIGSISMPEIDRAVRHTFAL